MLTIYLAPFVLILTIPMSAWIALILAIIMGVGEAGIGMSIMHDGAHGAYSSKPWLNKLVASSMYLLGSSVFNWKVQHNIKHHTFTNIFEYDPDISKVAIIRLCPHTPRKKFHRFQHIYAFPLYGLMTLFRLFGEISTLIQYTKDGITEELRVNPKSQLLKLILIKLLYLFIIIGLPILFSNFAVWQILLGFVALHATAGMIMTTIFQLAHVVEGTDLPLPNDKKVIDMEWTVHQLHTTSDFGRKNGLLSWYIGGLDFQIEHHLFQNICHIHYPKIAKIVEGLATKYGFDYNLKKSAVHAFASHYRRLKELGRNTAIIA
jgi:linoleoyl-CoA desaturase